MWYLGLDSRRACAQTEPGRGRRLCLFALLAAVFSNYNLCLLNFFLKQRVSLQLWQKPCRNWLSWVQVLTFSHVLVYECESIHRSISRLSCERVNRGCKHRSRSRQHPKGASNERKQ